MANIENTVNPANTADFIGELSTDNIWRANDMNRCLSDDLDTIESDITALETGKAATDHTHDGYAAASHTHDGYAAASHTHSDYAATNHSHAQSDITGLSDTLAGKASTAHNHNNDYISKDLQMTADDGTATISMPAGSTDNLLTKIEELGIGVHTFYSGSGNTGNPKSVEGWRGFIFKTSANQGFVQAYGSVGSVYTNYLDGTNGWRGWKAIFDCAPTPLWTGSIYLTANQTVTPSKPLSDCTHGWLLLWSDYDPGVSAQDYDFVTTMIPKRSATGQAWNGNHFLCDIPQYFTEDPANESRIIKYVDVYNDKIVGHASNSVAPRNDVVLRAIYEY